MNQNLIQNSKSASSFSSKQIFSDFLRISKNLMENSWNFPIDEESNNKNNVSNISANSSFFV